jgi:hypothetical protein
MAERRRTGKHRAKAPAPTADDDAPLAKAAVAAKDDDTERALARMVSLAIPLIGGGTAVVMLALGRLGPAILVLAGTALVATIGFLWASLRTLSGEAPLPEGVADHVLFTRIPAPERKRETLRALKDLEFEHSIGKIDEADYLTLSTKYRNTAKALMREMDEGLLPRRKRAERLIESYLAKRDLGASAEAAKSAREEGDDAPEESAPGAEGHDGAPDDRKSAPSPRVACAKCGVSNEPDASFCKKCGAPLASDSPDTTGGPDASV